MTQHTFRFYPGRRHILLLAALVVAIYVLLPQLGDFRSSWQLIRGARAAPAAAAAALTFATFAAAAGTYVFLAFRPLSYGRTLVIQLAATFVNRLLPAGLGALGANYLYLRHERYSAAQAGSMVGINNLLGLLGHSLLLAAVLIVSSEKALAPAGHHAADAILIVKAGLAILAVAALAGLFFGRRRVQKALVGVRKQLLSYRRRPASLVAALSTSLALTACNVSALYFCAHSLNVHLPFAVVMLVFTFGLSAGSAVPTPGGLGGFEAGLAAGFVAYGISPAPALAIALLYRLISYWLPLLVGAAAFAFCESRSYFST